MRNHNRAFTIAETLIAATVGLALLLAGYAMLEMASGVYHKVSGHQDAALQLKRASQEIQGEIVASIFRDPTPTVQILREQAAGPVGFSSDAICFLSAGTGADARGEVVNTESGPSYWQRNIIYYLAQPLGDPCPGLVDADGYEDACPDKVLIRKVVDSGPPTTDTLPVADKEEVLATMAPYITRPAADLDVSGMMGEPGVTSVEVVAVHLLTMRVELEPEPNAPGEVKVTLRAFDEEASQKTKQAGPQLLSGHRNTLSHVFSAFPRNNQ